MPTLAEKVQSLKLRAYTAGRTAVFWEETIKQYGEIKAEQFYLHLGHNHIERKGVEWEGLTLSRGPKEHEKLAIKGIAQAQESAKEQINKILSELREELILDGLKGIQKLDPAKYHTLILKVPPEFRLRLRDCLIATYKQGRRLVAQELGQSSKQDEEDEFDDLDELMDLTDSRVANDVQSRITGAAVRFALLGLAGAALLSAIQTEIQTGSVSYIDRASSGLANKVINIGRGDEARDRIDEWRTVEYSAILDQNLCENCAPFDGETAQSEDDLEPVPNVACLGGDLCRCFHVWINQ